MPSKNKLSKLRELKCVVCNKTFYKNISPSEILSGRGKVCSKECKNKLNSIQKNKSFTRICANCGKEFSMKPSEDRRGYARKYCSRKCFQPTETGEAISSDGYYVINRKKVHRIIMENSLGRKLSSSEIVHHINHNKLDNRIDNLQIMTKGEHNSLHFARLWNRNQHRQVMEQFLNRKLSRCELVKHIDGNKFNNSIENLKLCKKGEEIERQRNEQTSHNS